MKFPIGFVREEMPQPDLSAPAALTATKAVKSLVQVYFPERGTTLTYFNDRFDLKRGDFVFVEGKLEGIRGIVHEVSKNFKIKPADYKKVISVADIAVCGQFHFALSHLVSFDPNALPYEKARTWYLPPAQEDEFETSTDDTVFHLEKLGEMDASDAIWGRGLTYFGENRVRYLCVADGVGRAIVEGERAYEIEFRLQNGEISGLLCTCPCGYTCKHEVAAMLQLKETLTHIEKHYADLHHGYFATVAKPDFLRFAIDSRESGSFAL